MIGATLRNPQTQRSEPLTREEEYDFILQSQSGDTRTRDRFIEKNMRLIRAVASKYQGLAEWNDLENAGRLGVAVAIAKFDITKGYKFSTYATGPIKTEIKQLINELRGLSRTITDHLRKIDEASHELELELEREPTLVEIADRTGYSKQIITNAWNKERVVQTHSLNKLIGESQDSECIDLIEGSDNTWDFAEEISAYEYISQLPGREAYIIQARQKGYTNREIGEVLELSKERIRQLFNKALTTLKHLVDFGTDIARCPQQEQSQTIETTASASSHQNIHPSGEVVQLSPDLTTPETDGESDVKRFDALRLGGRIGKATFTNQADKGLPFVQNNLVVFRRYSNHRGTNTSRHYLASENQQCCQLGKSHGDRQGYLRFSQEIFALILLPLAFVYQSIRGFQRNNKPTNWRSMMHLTLIDVVEAFGIEYSKKHPRPPNHCPDFNENLC